MQLELATSNPTLGAYALTSIILTLNLLVLWILSGTKRARAGVAINPEDGARYGAPVSQTDPPEVARYLRAHRNAEATIYPLLVLGMVYTLMGGTAKAAVPVFAVFVVARVAHSIAYLRSLQPWRTIAFAVSLVAIISLMLATVVRLAR
jgi:uncharacterized MAPEG superfamily protein